MQYLLLVTSSWPFWTLKLVFEVKTILSPTSNAYANKDTSRWVGEHAHMNKWASMKEF